jgi:2TM domain
MGNEIIYRRAAVRATMQRAFYRHVMIYIVINALPVALNFLKDPNHLWFQWGMVGWGIGLLMHGLNVYSIAGLDHVGTTSQQPKRQFE